MLAAFAIIAALSAIFGAVSSIKQGAETQKAYEYQAALAEKQAQEEKIAAEYQAEQAREEGERLKARQRVAYNVSGVMSDGTPTDYLADTAFNLERDARAIQFGGQSRSTSLRLQGELSRMQGGAAKSAGWWNAGSSLLSGATTIVGAYARPGFDSSRYNIGGPA